MIVNLLRGPVGRITLIGTILLVLQTTVFADIRPAGVALQVLLAFSAAAGVVGGAERGMIAAFICGVLYDLGTGTPLGASSLTMGVAALVGSLITRINVDRIWWLSMIFVALGAAAGELAVPLLRSFIGETNVVSQRLIVIVPIVAVGAAALSPVMVPLSAWGLRIARSTIKVPEALE